MRKSDEYNAWLIEASAEARRQAPGKIAGKYKLSITAARPDKRKRDIDNLIKPTNDLLQAIGVVENDSDCELVCARWVTSGDGVAIRIEPAGIEQP